MFSTPPLHALCFNLTVQFYTQQQKYHKTLGHPYYISSVIFIGA